MLPMVQVKVLGILAVNEIFGLAPLHTVAVLGVVTVGLGLITTVVSTVFSQVFGFVGSWKSGGNESNLYSTVYVPGVLVARLISPVF